MKTKLIFVLLIAGWAVLGVAGCAYQTKIIDSPSEPSDAWLKVKYRDSWFYIATNDLKSRTSFTLLEAIFSSAVGNIPGAKPLLTLPVK